MSDYETLLVDVDSNGIARLTLNRPDARNAMSHQMIEELRTAAGQLGEDDAVRGVVLTGAGRGFCAGGDLKGMAVQASASREDRVRDATALATTLHELDTLPKPMIARVNGSAFGGGLGLISVCDIAVGVDTARFALTEVKLGLIPATISPYVVRRLGARNSRRVMLGAMEMQGESAVAMGLLDRVVSPDELDAAVNQELAGLLQCAPRAVAAAKKLIRFVDTHDVEENTDYTPHALADAWDSPEIQEGIDAFLNKRKPAWNIELGG